MVDVIIASYHDAYTILDSYFNDCADDLLRFIEESKINVITRHIRDKNCTATNIDNAFCDLKRDGAVVVYSHGTQNSLTYEDTDFITVSSKIAAKLLYTNACCCGNELGPAVVASNCDSFLGYWDTSWVVIPYKQMFIKCDNSGIKFFLEGNSVETTYYKMIDVYNNTIDDLYKIDMFAASKLAINRDILIMHGLGSTVVFS